MMEHLPAVRPDDTNDITVVSPVNCDMQTTQAIARQLRDYVRSVGLTVRIMGSEHVRIEGWQFLCHLTGLPFPSICSLTRQEFPDGNYAYLAEAVLIHRGREYRAFALCSSTEERWRNRPEFQLASMAQTRAAGKVLRLLLGWILPLAGYSATPAEEMEGEFEPAPSRPAPQARPRRARQQQQQPQQEQPQIALETVRELARQRLSANALRAVLQRYGAQALSQLTAEQLADFYARLNQFVDGADAEAIFGVSIDIFD